MARWILIAGLACLSLCAQGQDVLLFTKSSGANHFVIREPDGAPSVVQQVLSDVLQEIGGTLTATKDGGAITSENLANYDVVVFFTSGDITQSGTDGEPPIGPEAITDLIGYVEGGGGFIGFHSVSDTLHPPSPEVPSPFLEFLGGEFDRHGSQFVGTVQKQRAYHPLMIAIPDDWMLMEEWYIFKNYALTDATAIANLDPGDEGTRQSMYDRAPYPILWTKEPGLGRLAHIQLAHNESTWRDLDFQQLLQNALGWVGRVFPDGDTDGSGTVDSVDIQRTINTVLGLGEPGFAVDPNGDNVVNAVDIQIIINHVLLPT